MGSEIDLAIESILSKDVEFGSTSDLNSSNNNNSCLVADIMGYGGRLPADDGFPCSTFRSRNIESQALHSSTAAEFNLQQLNNNASASLFSDHALSNNKSIFSTYGNANAFLLPGVQLNQQQQCGSGLMVQSTSRSFITNEEMSLNLPPLFNSSNSIISDSTSFINCSSSQHEPVDDDDFLAMDIVHGGQNYPLLPSASLASYDVMEAAGSLNCIDPGGGVTNNTHQRKDIIISSNNNFPNGNADDSLNTLLLEFINLNFVEEAIIEVAFDVHRWAKCGLLFLLAKSDNKGANHKYNIQSVHNGVDIFGENALLSAGVSSTSGSNGVKPSKFVQQIDCVCPECSQPTAACRFAPHLEKCMGMGRNSSRVARRRLAAVCSSSSLTSLSSKSANKANDNHNNNHASSAASSNKMRAAKQTCSAKRTRVKLWIDDDDDDDDDANADGSNDNFNDDNDDDYEEDEGDSSTGGGGRNRSTRSGAYEDDDDWSNTSGGGGGGTSGKRKVAAVQRKKVTAAKTTASKKRPKVVAEGVAKRKQTSASVVCRDDPSPATSHGGLSLSNDDSILLSELLDVPSSTTFPHKRHPNILELPDHFDIPSPSL